MEKYIIIYITSPDKTLASQIGRACVEEGLAACVNIIDKIKSIYKWEGKLCEESECILIMKAVKENSDRIINKVKSLHRYSCPCIVVTPILDGNEDFLGWISESSK